ncbi:hypothetical protein BESB_045230 [Besnoitia besnoiti]|uniref:CPW-WPC domain-containing protein n=1 Tax=Besnoitia besnoiti TaxID=94643 RepID=A0A2A9MJB1_BESBE|nr:hypothetical protein BESB_045230 [Besnoitia besnoiti]PFH36331.1 hypothetical protein BESB_045230 [Besnoitia besnoiti]
MRNSFAIVVMAISARFTNAAFVPSGVSQYSASVLDTAIANCLQMISSTEFASDDQTLMGEAAGAIVGSSVESTRSSEQPSLDSNAAGVVQIKPLPVSAVHAALNDVENICEQDYSQTCPLDYELAGHAFGPTSLVCAPTSAYDGPCRGDLLDLLSVVQKAGDPQKGPAPHHLKISLGLTQTSHSRVLPLPERLFRRFVVALLFLASPGRFSRAQLVTEVYETCTAVEGEIARCGPGANCFIIGGVPTCHCIIDVATGLPLAGNPYKACTWDISGNWQLFSHYSDKKEADKEKKKPRAGVMRQVLSPLSNEPFVIRLHRTDALLRTRYLLGAIFVVTPLTSFAAGVSGRAFVDARDNISIIFEQAEGFADHYGRSIFLRTRLHDTSLTKLEKKLTDKKDLKGNWEKNDGTIVEIYGAQAPRNWPTFVNNFLRQNAVYWYNDPSYGDPALRMSTALFLDDTLPEERAAFQTNAQFVQLGWYGALRFGSNRIDIYSPATGEPIYSLLRIDTLPPFTPFGMPAMQVTAICTTHS